MKKKFTKILPICFLSVLGIIGKSSINAANSNFMICSLEEENEIDFSLTSDHYSDLGGPPRSIPIFPHANLKGHTLTLGTGCDNSNLYVITDDGYIVCTYIDISNGQIIDLPEFLSGHYILFIDKGSFGFNANINI